MLLRAFTCSIVLLGLGCNGVFGNDDVDVDTGGAGASSPSSGGSGGAGGAGGAGGEGTGAVGAQGQGGAGSAGGSGGTGGDGPGGGTATLCGPVPEGNLVVDGSFEEVVDGDPWYAYNVDMESVEAAGAADGCDGPRYLDLVDWSDIGTAWGTGLWSLLLATGEEELCVDWSFSARALTSEVYTNLMFAFEGEPYVVNLLTGPNGVYTPSPLWSLYQGTCRLTPPPFVDHINVYLSISEATESGSPDKHAHFDSLVVTPIECTAAIPPCTKMD